MSFDQLPRIFTVDKRIRESENFFRIEEAEARIVAGRKSLEDRIAATKRRKEKNKKLGISEQADPHMLPEVALPQFFSAHTLNTDPALAKFVQYNELVFPKPYDVLEGTGIRLQPDFIDKMWVSGFLDRANRDANQIARERDIARLKRLKNGKAAGVLLRGDSVAMKGKIGLADAAGSQSGEQGHSRDHVQGDNCSTFSQELSLLESAAPSISTSGTSVNSAKQLFLAEIEAREKAVKKAALDRQKTLLAKRKEKKHITAMMQPYQDSIAEYLLKKAKGDWGLKRKVEVEALSPGKEAIFASFQSVDLDKIFDLERKEHEAASVLQRWWKRFKRLVPWDNIVRCMIAAARIQRLVRGAITRKWVAKWYNSRNKVVTKVQANIRRMLSNIVVKPRQALEKILALKIQCVVRGRLGKLKWMKKRWNIAAAHIQAVWRGVVGRAGCDRRWLDKIVVPMQKLARKVSAKRYVEQVRAELNAAAMIIQKKIRSRQSCQKLTKRLLYRESDYRLDSISLLTTDEEYFQEKIGKVVNRLVKKDVRGAAEQASDVYQSGLAAVYHAENDLVETSRQREILSPRAIVQGYYQELNANVIDLRGKLTDLKRATLFDKLQRHWLADSILEHQVHTVELIATQRDQLARYRDTENAEKLERTQQRDLFERTMRKRHAIAAERRRWTVHYTTRNGKPDKKRRPGHPWDKSLLAGPEKSTYTAANVDIFAENGARDLRPGETGSVAQTLQRMSLQTYLEEVNAYEQILEPITKAMQGAFGGEPGKPTPDEIGYGEEGKKLMPAMWAIGAVPPAWRRPVSAGGTVMTAQELLRCEEAAQQKFISDAALGTLGAGGAQLNPRGGSLYNLADPENNMRKLRNAAEFERKKQIEKANKERSDRRVARSQGRQRSSAVVPWKLLDTLEGEKHSWQSEKAFLEFRKESASLRRS